MIVKYYDNGVWGYMDNVRQAAKQNIDTKDLIEEYDNCEDFKDVRFCGEKDIASFQECTKLADDVIASNKVFAMADVSDLFIDASYGNCHRQNLIDGKKALENYPAAVILLYLNDHKEYDTVVFVTNQECFLMNDKGQTIERLV